MEPITPQKDVEKDEYENSQFDPDVPTSLCGVMKRWVVPEIEKEPVAMTVPVLSLDEDEPNNTSSGSVPMSPPRHDFIDRFPSRGLFYFLLGGFILLVVLNLFLIFRK